MLNLNTQYSILVNTSDGFEDCWRPFFILLKKYWPSCNAPIYLNTENKDWSFPNTSIRCTKVQDKNESRLPWSECLIRALDQIKTPLVIYFQEDYFIDKYIREDIVNASVDYMLKHPEVEHIGLTKHGSHGPYEPYTENWLLKIRQNARYRISTQAGLWRVDALRSYLNSSENGWMFEIYGTWRAQRRPALFLTTKFGTEDGGPTIDYLHTGIIKGKWLPGIDKVFSENDINVDFKPRGFYTQKPRLVQKYEVALKLLKDPRRLISQLIGF